MPRGGVDRSENTRVMWVEEINDIIELPGRAWFAVNAELPLCLRYRAIERISIGQRKLSDRFDRQ